MTKEAVMKDFGKKGCIELYRTMVRIREFEEKIRFLFLEGKMPGTIHQYIGMEACAVGVCSALQKDDMIASTHRPTGHAIARGIRMKEIMAELYGRNNGCCKGKGGSMHIGGVARGMLPAIAIVGGNIPIVMGMALAFKIRKEKRVAVSFFGDGASNEGAFHEALNMASIYELPAVFVCENNQYAASTNIKKTINITNIADRAEAYGMRGDIADGMDVLDVYTHSVDALQRARSGNGPTLLELKTFRFCGHSRRDPNNYMSEEEKNVWKQRDPILQFAKNMQEKDLATETELDEAKKTVEHEVNEAIEHGRTSPEPAPSALFEDLYVTMEVPR